MILSNDISFVGPIFRTMETGTKNMSNLRRGTLEIVYIGSLNWLFRMWSDFSV